MRILLTNVVLSGRTGTEVVTIELAQALAARGHEVVVFSRTVGESGAALRAQHIRVTDRLDELDFEAEVVHGNHNVELVQGLIRYPHAPGLFVCHDPNMWANATPDLSRIRAYVAVCGLTRERIRRELPRVASQIQFIPNAVDLDRFLLRPPLPARPARALALTKHSGHLDTLRAACRRAGLPLDVLGPGAGQIVDDLPSRLRDYDLVFATARMAIEAMAVGCAVIVVDERGLAGLATSQVVEAWRTKNFGMEALTEPVTEQGLAAAIARYDARDAAGVAANVRAAQPLVKIAAQYEAIYRKIAAEHVPVAAEVESRELSRLLQQWLPMLNGVPPIMASLIEQSASSEPRSPEKRPSTRQPRSGFWNRLGRSIDKRPRLKRSLSALGIR